MLWQQSSVRLFVSLWHATRNELRRVQFPLCNFVKHTYHADIVAVQQNLRQFCLNSGVVADILSDLPMSDADWALRTILLHLLGPYLSPCEYSIEAADAQIATY